MIPFPDIQPATGSAPRTLVVGTALTAAQLHHYLAVADPRPKVLGCLVPDTTDAADTNDIADTGDPAKQPAAAPSQPHGPNISNPATTCPVLGRIDTLESTIAEHDIEQVLISLPVSLADLQRDLANRLKQIGTRWRALPTLADQLAGRCEQSFRSAAGAVTQPAPTLDLTALIDRQPRKLDEDAIRNFLQNRRVLITGAGGSIGSELARLVSVYNPARLLLVERSENALFEIDRELGRVHPTLDKRALLHDVTNRDATFSLLREQQPDIIFHAAAHKHVPMMEDHPFAAVENNFFGTRSIADAASATGVAGFVMISTDKAVNPSSVMGASKRLAELYIQHLNTRSRCTFSMVRFGNVLGSACSVLPIWSGQLAHAGPITVTHPDMTRYFMTIPEAAGLVMQAAALSGERDEGGEVFLLDMGRPVRIVDLARRFLLTQGFEPDVDIPIQFTGIRPGEKLFEELAYDGEDMLPTEHEAIHIWRTSPPDAAQIQQIVSTFERLRDQEGRGDNGWHHVPRNAILNALRIAIPEMTTAAAG